MVLMRSKIRILISDLTIATDSYLYSKNAIEKKKLATKISLLCNQIKDAFDNDVEEIK